MQHRLRVYVDFRPMGRRSRHRSREALSSAATPPSEDRMARVRVPADTWAEFRALAGDRPVAAVLGELVTREVERQRSRRVREREVDERELIDALDRAGEQQADLAAIVERLERLRPVRPTE